MTTTVRTVVVGVDGTPDGERAVEYAAALARRDDLHLRLVYVSYDYKVYGPVAPYLPRAMAREIGESVLHAAAKRADEVGFPSERITTVLTQGRRTSTLLRDLDDARCLVLGSRSPTLKHVLTGATSLSVIAHASLPVRCVPPSWSGSRATFDRIVVGVDGSKADPEILKRAFAEAEAADARLDIVHAWPSVSAYDAAMTGRVLDDQWEKTARQYFATSIGAVAAAHPGVTWELCLNYQHVAVAMRDAAAEADLLILGRRGHHSPMSMLVGSNTRALLQHAPCPVEVVPVGNDHD